MTWPLVLAFVLGGMAGVLLMCLMAMARWEDET